MSGPGVRSRCQVSQHSGMHACMQTAEWCAVWPGRRAAGTQSMQDPWLRAHMLCVIVCTACFCLTMDSMVHPGRHVPGTMHPVCCWPIYLSTHLRHRPPEALLVVYVRLLRSDAPQGAADKHVEGVWGAGLLVCGGGGTVAGAWRMRGKLEWWPLSGLYVAG
jgi:hypothetical protein